MKFSSLVLALATCGIAQAGITHPSTERPLLVKSYDVGLVRPAQAVSLRCLIFQDHVTVYKTAGALTSTTTTPITVTGDVLELVGKAATGKVIEEEAPTDGPITAWVASPARALVPLLSEGSVKYKNQAAEAQTLVNFMNLNCPTM